MTDTYFDEWLDRQVGLIREAVRPVLKALYAERGANRARIGELEQANAELAAALDECRAGELPPTEPQEPEPTAVYDATRLQVLWLPFNTTLADWTARVGDGQRIYAAVVMADLKNKGGEWAQIPVMLRSKGIKVYAYVRAPVHARVGAFKDASVGPGTGAPFENAVYHLCRERDAWARDLAGNILWHPGGYDAYLTPWRIAAEHAALVRQHAWDAAYYDGLLVDGLVTNQIYAGGGADFDGDRVADVVKDGWAAVSQKQRAALMAWAGALSGIPIIGNGAWEPQTLTPFAPSVWLPQVTGTYDEDQTHPFYRDGNDFQQEPGLSGRWEMHRRAAADWTAAGKEVWLGGNYRLFNLPRAQGLQFLIASALVVGARVVANEQHTWWGRCGKALGAAVQFPDGQWGRDFEGGRVMVDPNTKTGAIL